MATDATTAPVTAATSTTPAPTAGEQTASAAPAAGETTAAPAPFDFGKLVAERLGGKKGDAASAPASVAAPKTPAAEVATEAVAAKEPPAPVAVATPAPVDDIDARLKALHDANARAAESRKAQKRQAELEGKAKSLESAHEKEVALAKAIEEARGKRDFIGLLKAAGFTIDEMRNTPMIVDMVDQFGKLDEGDVEKPKAVTEADIARMLKEREDEAEAKRKADAEAAKAKRIEELTIARNEYFAEVKIHFKAGEYPALKQAGVTQGGLDKYRADYVARNPNHAPSPKELLDLAEKDLRALWKRNADALAKLDGGKSPAPATPKPNAAPASPQPRARTVNSRMSESAGETATEPEKPAKKTYRDKEQEMKDSFVSRFAK